MSGSITINSNQASLSAQRRLGQSTSSLQQSFTRLASGLRINTSSDDAAGLAISESLNVDAAVFSQGVRNLNDSISLLNIAESALVELSNISIRLQELAAQSSNGTLGNQQRSALDEEADALIEEYNRITASVDFNDIKLLDGSLEVLTAQGGYGSSAGLQLSIGSELARMAGDGTFLAPITLDSVGNCPLDIELHDSNSDGILDLYVTTPQDEGYIAIFQGNGDGSFQARRTYESEGNLWDMAFGDFNGDGIDDVAVEEDTFNSLHIYLANSDGSLNAAVSFDGVSAEIPEVGDLNNDGKLDIVSGNQSGGLQVFLGNGDGSFSLGDTYAKTFDSLNSIELADFNGDGLLDFLSSGTYAAGNAPVEIRFGKGDGSFTAPVSYMYAGWGEEMEFADFNDDGKLDLVSVGRFEQNSFVFIGNGDGSFKHSVAYAESGEDEIYTVDVFDANGDGYMDFVTSGQDLASANVFIGNGDGSFKARVTYAAGTNPRGSDAGDINGDGVYDLVYANYGAGEINILLGNSNSRTDMATLNLNLRETSLQAMDELDTALQRISAERASIGASQSRIEVAVRNLQQSRENYISARSQIVDADIASESAQLVRKNILQQAGAAVLAQANQAPALALELLRL